LTIWDLDDGRAPNITGQLHVLLFKFNRTDNNREVFEHFGSRLYVDPLNGVDRVLPAIFEDDDAPVPGGPLAPFRTFPFTYYNYPVWDGSEIVLNAGFYSAVGVYPWKVRIVSQGGSAVLGQ
jgi:hypothetical protein